MRKIILHIPHSSTGIPDSQGFIVDADFLNSEILKLTDWYTDELFYSQNDIMLIAGFSRIFCDVERFENDAKEKMSQFGMGVLYQKSDDGKEIRLISPELRHKILTDFYRKHHSGFTQAVQNQLCENGEALIIDCHSFPDIPLKRDLNQDANRPDFNVGTDPFHTPEILFEVAVRFFEEKGFSVGVDWPYSGSIVPLKFYQNDKRVKSIMLEINRKLYLNGATNKKSEGFVKIRKVVGEFIESVRNTFLSLTKSGSVYLNPSYTFTTFCVSSFKLNFSSTAFRPSTLICNNFSESDKTSAHFSARALAVLGV